jgi:hypothetical protein
MVSNMTSVTTVAKRWQEQINVERCGVGRLLNFVVRLLAESSNGGDCEAWPQPLN